MCAGIVDRVYLKKEIGFVKCLRSSIEYRMEGR